MSVVRRGVRQIALDIYRAGSAAARNWDPGSDVQAELRRLMKKERFLMRGRYLELAAWERPRL